MHLVNTCGNRAILVTSTFHITFFNINDQILWENKYGLTISCSHVKYYATKKAIDDADLL